MNQGLGKGLSALLGETLGDVIESEKLAEDLMVDLPIESISVGLYQPRKNFTPDSLFELADSITKNGLLQPIIVAKDGDIYSIIAGERRWRACKLAGFKQIRVIVKDANSKQKLEFALIENIQRQDLNAVEEAEGYLRLMGEFGYTQEELSSILGKSRSHVANIIRINTLPESIKRDLVEGRLSMGHARSLVGHANAIEIAAAIIDKGLNVRQTENLSKSWNKQPENSGKRPYGSSVPQDGDLNDLVASLSSKFGMKVTIETVGDGGKVIFHYNTLEQLDDILTKLH